MDLDALMADLCSIEQELSTVSKPNSSSRGHSKGQQRAPGGPSASTKHTGTSGGGSSGGTETYVDAARAMCKKQCIINQ